MENKKKFLFRLLALGFMLCLIVGIAGLQLFSLQIVQGETFREKSERRMSGSMTVRASRGEILDRYGSPIVTNDTAYLLRLNYAYWNKEKQNETILKLAGMVDTDEGAERPQSLPVTFDTPYAYTVKEHDDSASSAEKSSLKTLRDYIEKKKWDADISADELIANMRENYKIAPSFSQQEARLILEVRYQMEVSQFSLNNPFTFATNVSRDLVVRVLEQHRGFEGVEVDQEPVRQYRTDLAAHLIGRTGPIYKEEWEEYKAKGYALNATIGKDGMEEALEEYLRGTDGLKGVEMTISGAVSDEIELKAPQPGNNCILTLDLGLQKVAEDSLARTIKGIRGAGGGAVVVEDVNTGEILVSATYPTFKMSDYKSKEIYNNLTSDPLKPLFNRAISGLYAPGSTFKPLTSVAGLEEGVIDGRSRIRCTGTYYFYRDTFGTNFTPHCLRRSGHGWETVVTALRDSCNIFFYDTGRQLTIEKLVDWAKQFGLGQKTGLELSGERSGQIAGPETRERMRENVPALERWQGGDVVQAAIGQSDHLFTPVQICNYIATLANGGTHYRAHLLKSVKAYDYSGSVLEVQPEVLNEIKISDATLALVKEGMQRVTDDGGTAAAVFRNYPIEIAGKSGTVQVTGKQSNGLFVSFAPYHNPEIAIAVVVEGGTSGNSVAPVVRDIYDAYFMPQEGIEPVPREYALIK